MGACNIFHVGRQRAERRRVDGQSEGGHQHANGWKWYRNEFSGKSKQKRNLVNMDQRQTCLSQLSHPSWHGYRFKLKRRKWKQTFLKHQYVPGLRRFLSIISSFNSCNNNLGYYHHYYIDRKLRLKEAKAFIPQNSQKIANHGFESRIC